MHRATAIKVFKTIAYIGIYGGLLMPLVFVPMVIFPFVFSKLIFFQVLIGLCFPAYLALAWMEPQYRPRWSPFYVAIGAYFVALLVSVIFAIDPVKAWWGNQERMNGLFTLIHFLLWLTMTVSIIKTWDQWKNLLNYQIFLGIFMAIVALLQKPFPNLLLFPAGGRVGGLLDNPIYMGAYQLFVLFFLALLWFKTESKGWRAWYIAAFILSLLAMFAAGSRGPFMGLIFGIVLSAVTYGLMSKSKKIKAGIIIVVAVCTLGYVGMVTLGVRTQAFKSFSVRFPETSRLFNLQTGTAGRFIAWDIAWHGFLERPLTGWGLDDFNVLFNMRYNPQSLRAGYGETWFDRAHNTVLDVFSMTGLIGFAAFVALWVLLYVTILRAKKKGYIDAPTTAILVGLPAGYFLQNIFVFDHPAAFSMSYLLYAFIICLGYPVFAGKAEEVDKEPKVKEAKPAPWVMFGIVQVVFILLVYLTSALPAYASYLSIKANNAFSVGDLDGWLAYAERAAQIQTPYLDEQTFLLSRNLITLADGGRLNQWPDWKVMFKLAQDITDRQLVSHGVDAHPRFIYANLLQSVGRATQDADLQKQAEEQYKAAIADSPKRQQLYFGYGRLLTEMGRNSEAMQQYKTAAELDDQIGEAWWYVGVSYWFDQNDLKDGATYVAKSMKVQFPYGMRNAQDALLVAQAYDILADKDGLKALMDHLPNLPASGVDVYIAIAKAMEHQGLIQERNMILGAVLHLDPSYQPKLQGLIDGTAKTIDESFKMATNTASASPTISLNPTSTQQEAIVATATPAAPTVTGAPHGPRK